MGEGGVVHHRAAQVEEPQVATVGEVGEPEPLAGVPGRFRGWPTEVVVVGIGTFLTWQLGFDPRAGISTRDWPVTPQQSLAGQWRRIAQEEHFPGRADEVGDDLGRRVLVARLART